MDLIIKAPIAAVLAVIIGAIVGYQFLGLRQRFAEPIPFRGGRTPADVLCDIITIYAIVLLLTLSGLASFFLPTLPKDTPSVVIVGMAVSIVGVVRTLSIWCREKNLSTPLMLGTAAGVSIGIYIGLTIPELLKDRFSITPEMPWAMIATVFMVGSLVEILARRVTGRADGEDAPGQAGNLHHQ